MENGIADGIDFFHGDALSSAVAMKVNCDLQLTLMASSLYKLFGRQLGEGYEKPGAATSSGTSSMPQSLGTSRNGKFHRGIGQRRCDGDLDAVKNAEAECSSYDHGGRGTRRRASSQAKDAT